MAIVAQYQETQVSFNDEGWFNATNVAERFGKEPAQFMRLPSTIEYIEALKRKYGNFTYLKTRRGASGGTWMHPKLGVQFARWCDLDFAIWCDEQIDKILRGTIDVKRLRHEAASSYKVMSNILQIKRDADGKKTKAHHYINEALLINAALTGKRESINRDELGAEALDLLAKLEERNTVLIAQGIEYQQRKMILQAFAKSSVKSLEAA